MNKDIRIINSYEEIKRYKSFEYFYYITKNIHYINNENELKENIEILIKCLFEFFILKTIFHIFLIKIF